MTKVKEFLNHTVAKKWNNGRDNSGITQLAEILNELCIQNCSILLVGTGSSYEQYHDWPNILNDVWGARCSYLEIDKGYINRWKNEKYFIYEGSVINIKTIIKDSFDIILWIQGPEHIKYEDMFSTFEAMFEKSNRGILCTCPWGGYYDYQGELNGNLAEAHVQKSMDEKTFGPEFNKYERLFGGCQNGPDGQILIWRKK